MDKLGAYEIVGELGHGGMATVYKGYHRALNRYVAIKMIHQAQAADDVSRARFAREAQIVAGMHHPHIVPIYDYAESERDPYLVMKFIDGCTLKTVLADGPIELRDVLDIIKPLASAIDYAHSQGVLHRDIKPANVLLDKSGTVYLSDFGLARLMEHGATTMSVDMMIGTPYYMSPEQGRGVTELTPATDIYSFGVVLYELLVGRVPYNEGTPLFIVHAHISKELPAPSSINPNISPLAEMVLLRALAKDPDDRYPNATQMVEELADALKGVENVAVNVQALHTAADSLAKARPELQSASIKRAKASTVASPQTAARNRRGLIAGALAVAVLVPVLWFGLQRITQVNASPTATEAIAAAPNTTADADVLTLFEQQVTAGNIPNAVSTFLDHWPATDQQVDYVARAVAITETTRRFELGYVIYGDAFFLGQDAGHLREALGSAFYDIAVTEPVLNPGFYRRQITELERRELSPIGQAMFARLLIEAGELDTAQTLLDRAAETAPDLPELHLVLGEFYAKQDRLDEARAEWENVSAIPNIPAWITERALDLINQEPIQS